MAASSLLEKQPLLGFLVLRSYFTPQTPKEKQKLNHEVFANSLGDWGSIPGQVIPKTKKNGN